MLILDFDEDDLPPMPEYDEEEKLKPEETIEKKQQQHRNSIKNFNSKQIN